MSFGSSEMLTSFDGREWEIAGLDEQILSILMNVVMPYQIPEDLQRSSGLQHVRGIVLHGDPGVGKTTIARAMCKFFRGNVTETDKSMEPNIIMATNIFSHNLGVSEQNVKAIFEPARAYKKKVDNGTEKASKIFPIVIDEIDAICRTRIENTGGGDGVESGNKVLSIFLSELDGIAENNHVFVIGMTNRLSAIDPAMLRPGRLSMTIHIPRPPTQARFEILKLCLAHLEEWNHLDLSMDEMRILAESMINFTGADIKEVVRQTIGNVIFQNLSLVQEITKNNPSAVEFYQRARNQARTEETKKKSLRASNVLNNNNNTAPKQTDRLSTTRGSSLSPFERMDQVHARIQRLKILAQTPKHATKPPPRFAPQVFYKSGSKDHPQRVSIPWCFHVNMFLLNENGAPKQLAKSTLEDTLCSDFKRSFLLLLSFLDQTSAELQKDTICEELSRKFMQDPVKFVQVRPMAETARNMAWNTVKPLSSGKTDKLASNTSINSSIHKTTIQGGPKYTHRFETIKVRYQHLAQTIEKIRREKQISSSIDFTVFRPLCPRHENHWNQITHLLQQIVQGCYYRKFTSIFVQGPPKSGRTTMVQSSLAHTNVFSPLFVFDIASELIAYGRDEQYGIERLRHMIIEVNHCKSPACIVVDGYERLGLFPRLKTMIEECASGKMYENGCAELRHPVVFLVVSDQSDQHISEVCDFCVAADLTFSSDDEILSACAELKNRICAFRNSPISPSCLSIARYPTITRLLSAFTAQLLNPLPLLSSKEQEEQEEGQEKGNEKETIELNHVIKNTDTDNPNRN